MVRPPHQRIGWRSRGAASSHLYFSAPVALLRDESAEPMATIGFADALPVRLEESCHALAYLRRSIRTFLAFSERVSREAGLGPEEYHALLVIRSAGVDGVTTAHLAAELMLGPRATLDLVERLRRAVLVERVRDAADRRRVLVVLSASGRTLSTRLIGRHLLEVRRNAPRLVGILSSLADR
jgi:DNA-binding MarR family transcriptional regulator